MLISMMVCMLVAWYHFGNSFPSAFSQHLLLNTHLDFCFSQDLVEPHSTGMPTKGQASTSSTVSAQAASSMALNLKTGMHGCG